MSDFSFLNQYLIPSTEENTRRLYEDNKHLLFAANQDSVVKTELSLELPIELKEFYIQIGYGFFHHKEEFTNNTLLDPDSFRIINLRQEYYEFDPDLELYQGYHDKLIFFEVNEGVYLLISKDSVYEKNPIYYFEEKIADSLEEFLIQFDREGNFFE